MCAGRIAYYFDCTTIQKLKESSHNDHWELTLRNIAACGKINKHYLTVPFSFPYAKHGYHVENKWTTRNNIGTCMPTPMSVITKKQSHMRESSTQISLSNGVLSVPYGDTDLSTDLFKLWFVAWQRKAFAWIKFHQCGLRKYIPLTFWTNV